MLISLGDIIAKHRIHPEGVIHVGAHYAQEVQEYKNCGIEEMVFIEPCFEAFTEMERRLARLNFIRKPQTFQVACGYEEGEMIMNVSPDAEGQSNSILKPYLHLTQHPEVHFTGTETVEVKQLDNLPIRNPHLFDMLMIDVQGYELEVLKGAVFTLENYIDIVYSEVNRGETYQGNALIGDMDYFLKGYGFERVETYWPSPNWTWGDAVWIKKNVK